MMPPARKSFARRRAMPRMDPVAAARQGRAVSLAFAAFGDGARAMAFLNTPHPELGGRPIDLAVASATDLLRVETAIAARPPHDPAMAEPSENPDRLAG